MGTRLRPRPVPVAVGGVERPVPRQRCAPAGTVAPPRPAPRARWPTSRPGSPARPTSSPGRSPLASVNFVTAHDGFTLADLVSYESQAQRGQRRGQPRRQRQQPLAQRRRRRPDRRPDVLEAVAAQAAARPSGDAAAVRRGAHARRRRRDRPHPADGNNNAYCQDNASSPGWPGPTTGVTRQASIPMLMLAGQRTARHYGDAHPCSAGRPSSAAAGCSPGTTSARCPTSAGSIADGHDHGGRGTGTVDTVTVHLSAARRCARGCSHGQRVVDDSYVFVLHTGAGGRGRDAPRTALGAAVRAAAGHRRRRPRWLPAPVGDVATADRCGRATRVEGGRTRSVQLLRVLG